MYSTVRLQGFLNDWDSLEMLQAFCFDILQLSRKRFLSFKPQRKIAPKTHFFFFVSDFNEFSYFQF